MDTWQEVVFAAAGGRLCGRCGGEFEGVIARGAISWFVIRG